MNVHQRRSKGAVGHSAKGAHLNYTILQAMDDEHLFARWFQGKSWARWRCYLAALFGLPLSDEQLEVFKTFTGRTAVPTKASQESWLCIGRRGGKSQVLAFVAVYLATFRSYDQYLAPGEKATVRVMAADRDQARSIFRFIGAMLKEVPLLERLVIKETAESLELSNNVVIEVGTASYRSSRGYSFAAVLADEVSFWMTQDGSTNADTEVLAAVRPGMATIPGAMLLCASSPYARRGTLWQAYDRWYGKNDAPLVWKASTRDMNETVPQSFIDEETLKDPANAAAEYGAEFRSDIEAFISMDVLRSCIQPGVHERAPELRWRYYAFVDPSGGSGDSFTLAIAHKEGATCVLDLIREVRPPFSPEQVTEEFAAIVKKYRITKVVGDRYAGEWPRERFRFCGLNYELVEDAKSQIYQQFLPIVNSTRRSCLIMIGWFISFVRLSDVRHAVVVTR